MFEWLDRKIESAEENLARLKDYKEKIDTWIDWETLDPTEAKALAEYIHNDVNHTDNTATNTIMDFIFKKCFGENA